MKRYRFVSIRWVIFGIAIFSILTVVVAVSPYQKKNDDLSGLWMQLKKEETAQKPKSVIKIADEIIARSKQERNSIDEAIAWRKKFEAMKSYNFKEWEGLLQELQKRLNENKDDILNTFLHLLTADIYLEYRDNYGDLSFSRAEIPDSSALTLDSWTKTQYKNVLQKHLRSAKPLSGDSAVLTGTDGQFLFPRRDNILKTLPTAQQHEDYLLSLLYKRAYDCAVFDVPETLEVKNFFVAGSDYLSLDISTGDENMDNYLRIWQNLLRSIDPNKRLFIQLDLVRLDQLSELCHRQVITNIQQKDLLDTLLLQMIEQHKDEESAIDLLKKIGQRNRFNLPSLSKNVDYLKNTIKRYNKSDGVEELKQSLITIEFPVIGLGSREAWVEGVEDSITIKARNVDEVNLSVYYAPFPSKVKWMNTTDDVAILERIKNPGKLLFTEKIMFQPQEAYQETSISKSVTFDRAGIYFLKLVDGKKRKIPETNKPMESYLLIKVSRYLYYTQSDGRYYEMNVLRGIDGGIPRKPIQIEQFDILDAIVTDPTLRPTDQWGAMLLEMKQKRRAFRVIEGGIPVTTFFQPYAYPPQRKEEDKLQTKKIIHSDRAIYRPGQKVFYKGVISKSNSKEFELTTNEEYLLEVLDSSSKVVFAQKGKTSDMGSFAGSFMLPESIMGGNCSFSINGDYAGQFRVEEYKRPTFELTIDPIIETYTFGDTIKISGHIKNYAGISAGNVEVNLSLGVPSTYYRINIRYPELPLSSTTVKTDQDGRFEWNYHLPVTYAQYFPDRTYHATSTIKAVCMDEKGESKETTSSLSFAYTPYSFVDNMPELIDLGEPTNYTPTVNNQHGKLQSIKVHMQWLHLSSKQVFEAQLNSNESTDFSFTNKYPKGNYQVKLYVTDGLGRKSEQEHKVYLFDSRNGKLPESLSFYLRRNIDDREFASFTMATTLPEQNVTIDVFNEFGRIERIRLKLSNEIKKVVLPYKSAYGKKATLYITYVERCLIRNVRFDVSAPTERQPIQMQWTTLRDKMTPNAEEIWKLRWTDLSKEHSKAELCVTMYDASLNQFGELFLPSSLKIESGDERFPYYYNNPYSYKYNPSYQSTYCPYFNLYADNYGSVFNSLDLDQIVVVGYGAGRKNTLVGATKGINRMLSKLAPQAKSSESAMDMEVMAGAPLDASALRSELVETALFEPQLRPDKEGYCTIKFHAPQTLTEWNVKAWGYNQKGDVVRLDTTVVTRKELTVQPNVPRFFREGDSPVLMANVGNLTQEAQRASVRMILYTIEGDTLLNSIQTLDLPAKSTVPVSASWTVPGKPDQIIYEVWATSAKHSDGERHLIPLLRRDVTVNSGTSFFLKGETTELVPIPDELKKTLQNGRFDEAQLEIVQNPIFFAVKSLPLILDLSSDNALAVAHTLFARMMAQHIIKQNREVISMIQAWERSSDGKTSLERSAQFKLTSVDQTPFFSAVNREQEAMKQWSYWINNPEQLENSNRAAFEVLKTMQQPDGGFCWFKGERSSFFITQHVAKLLTTLSLHGANTADGEHELRVKLINYLDKEMIRVIELTPARKRDNDYWEGMLTGFSEYLSIRANYRDIPFPSKLLPYHKRMIKQIGKGWKNCSFLTQARLIQVAISYGFKKEAKAIIESLLEHTQVDQLGRYFPNNRAWVLSNTGQLSTQIAFIEALIAENGHPQEVKELTQWIFAQYQTQRMFNTTVATQGIDLILRNLETVNPEGSFVVTMGGHTLQPTQEDLNSPVLTYRLTADDLKKAHQKIEIRQSGKSIAWGGLLYRYQSPIDEVQDKSGDLSVRKQYFRPTDDNKLTPVDAAHPLKVGEKLIMRYTIKASRDFDYVQIQDLKGAFSEPVRPLSQYRAEGGLWFYSEPKDKMTNLFFYFIPKGTYTIDYPVWVNASGEYSIGTASIQSAMTPEFVSFSGAQRMKVEQ